MSAVPLAVLGHVCCPASCPKRCGAWCPTKWPIPPGRLVGVWPWACCRCSRPCCVYWRARTSLLRGARRGWVISGPRPPSPHPWGTGPQVVVAVAVVVVVAVLGGGEGQTGWWSHGVGWWVHSWCACRSACSPSWGRRGRLASLEVPGWNRKTLTVLATLPGLRENAAYMM
jgi:hypothetical protein